MRRLSVTCVASEKEAAVSEQTTDPQLTRTDLRRARDAGERMVPTVKPLAGVSLIGADFAGANLIDARRIGPVRPPTKSEEDSCPI